MSTRLSKACNRCRLLRRRCSETRPCSRCMTAGAECHERARAGRSRAFLGTGISTCGTSGEESIVPETHCENLFSEPGGAEILQSPIDGIWPMAGAVSPRDNCIVSFPGQLDSLALHTEIPLRDPFEVVTDVLRSTFMAKFGSTVSLNLEEPRPFANGKTQLRPVSAGLKSRVLTFSEASSLIDTFFSRSRATRIVSNFELRQHLRNLFFPSETEILFYPLETEIDLEIVCQQHGSCLPVDSMLMLFSALAVGAYYKGAADLAETLFKRSTAELSTFMGKSTYDIAVALFLQQAFAVGTGPTNQAKSIAAHATAVARELGLNRFSKQKTTLERAWLFVLIYFADIYFSTSYLTRPLIRREDIDEDIFNFVSEHEPNARKFINMLRLNGEIMERLFEGTHSFHLVLELEQKMAAHIRSPLSEAKPASLPQPLHEARIYEYNETLAEVHLCWLRIAIRSPFLNNELHAIPSTCICLRAAQKIINRYTELLLPIDGTVVVPSTWRQVKRIMSSAYIVLIALWYREATELESSAALHSAILLLKSQRHRWDETADKAVNILLQLMAASSLPIPEFDNSLAGCNASYQYLDTTASGGQNMLYPGWSEQAIIVDPAVGEWGFSGELFDP